VRTTGATPAPRQGSRSGVEHDAGVAPGEQEAVFERFDGRGRGRGRGGDSDSSGKGSDDD